MSTRGMFWTLALPSCLAFWYIVGRTIVPPIVDALDTISRATLQ